MPSRKPKVVKLARRPRVLHEKTIESLAGILKGCKSGEVTAVVAVAFRPGWGCWFTRSKMTTKERINIIGQLEYLKWLLIQDEEEVPND